MEKHLLISSFLESLIYFNKIIFSLSENFVKSLSSFTFSFCLFYDINLERLNKKLELLATMFKDKNLKVKSNKYKIIFCLI